MGEALGAAVALTLFMMVTVVTFLALLNVWELQSTEASAVTLRRVERLNTRVSITATAPTGAGCDTYTATVSNPGDTAIGDFTGMDLIINYTDTDSDMVSARLDHVSGAVAANQWRVSGIAPDTRDQNSWNPGEVATLEFNVDPAMSSVVSGAMVPTTPFGVSDTAYFGC